MSDPLLEYQQARDAQTDAQAATAQATKLRADFFAVVRKFSTESIFHLFPPSAGETAKRMQGLVALSMVFYDAVRSGWSLAGVSKPANRPTAPAESKPDPTTPAARVSENSIQLAAVRPS